MNATNKYEGLVRCDRKERSDKIDKNMPQETGM
jgi:hypothetical protein